MKRTEAIGTIGTRNMGHDSEVGTWPRYAERAHGGD